MKRATRRDSTRPSRAAAIAAIAAAFGATLSGCAASPAPAPPVPTASPRPDFARLVDIGGGRELFFTCRGQGEPTVVLISGTGGAADEWMVTMAADDPQAAPRPSDASVFDRVAGVTRVCAYDRPGTSTSDGARSASTPVPQPTTASDGVRDLDALLTATGETGPCVVVGASWGGLIAQLFLRTHPDDVKGMVLVDSASMFLRDAFTAEQWTRWMEVIAAADAGDGAERPDYEATVAQWGRAEAMRWIPTVVLSSDREWDLSVTPGQSTWHAWLEAQEELAASLRARHVSETHSGHGIHVEQPALVVEAIESVIDDVRDPQPEGP